MNTVAGFWTAAATAALLIVVPVLSDWWERVVMAFESVWDDDDFDNWAI